MLPSPIRTYLETELANPEEQELYAHVMGSTDPDILAGYLNQAFTKTGCVPEKVLFSAMSVGAVFGIEDADGQKAVLKIFPAANKVPELKRMISVQQELQKAGFPLPSLRSGLIKIAPGLYGVLMDYVAGEPVSGHSPQVRQELARHLALFSRLSRDLDFPLVSHAFAVPPGDIWPYPHKPGVDLKQKVYGSVWLTKRVARSHSIIQKSGLPQMCAHGDWGVKNARFRDGKLVAVFDWDSLCRMSEAEMVGRAAGQFSIQWGTGEALLPTSEEAEAFFAEYQSYAGRPFSKLERKVAGAAADWLIAVIARFGLKDAASRKGNEFYALSRNLAKSSLLPA